MSGPIIDCDEHGNPVPERYRRLGAGSKSSKEEGLYVRFEPGFGFNVYLGFRAQRDAYAPMIDHERMGTSLGGWERLCELVDEWRARGNDHAQG